MTINNLLDRLAENGLIVTNKDLIANHLEQYDGSLQSFVVKLCQPRSGLLPRAYFDPRCFREGEFIRVLGELGFDYKQVQLIMHGLQAYRWAPEAEAV